MLCSRPATPLSTSFAYALALILAALLSLGQAGAQASATERKGAEVAAFGGYLGLDPGYGSSLDHGGTVGLSFTRFFVTSPLAPAIEARVSSANGPVANEKTYLVGVRAGGEVAQRFHPYVDFLFGKGTIHYQVPNDGVIGDSSAVFDFGAGVDFDLDRRFQVKVDFQTQRWRPGIRTYYYPSGLLLGMTYRIPFRRYVSQRDLR